MTNNFWIYLVSIKSQKQNMNVNEFYFALNKSMFDGSAVPCTQESEFSPNDESLQVEDLGCQKCSQVRGASLSSTTYSYLQAIKKKKNQTTAHKYHTYYSLCHVEETINNKYEMNTYFF